jgi:hypothetical protein
LTIRHNGRISFERTNSDIVSPEQFAALTKARFSIAVSRIINTAVRKRPWPTGSTRGRPTLRRRDSFVFMFHPEFP